MRYKPRRLIKTVAKWAQTRDLNFPADDDTDKATVIPSSIATFFFTR